MKALKLSVLSLLALLTLSQAAAPVMAQPFRPYNNYNNGYHSYNRMNQRINRGVWNGQLTRNEARKLQRGESRLWHAQRMARANGHVSPYEARRLANMRARQSWNIFQQKHDWQVRR